MSQLIYLVPLGITLLSSFVYLRRLDQPHWFLLGEDLDMPFISLNVSGFEPGYYEPRIVASDRMSNPPDMAKSSETRGRLILVDNQPPDIVPPDTDHPRTFRVRDNFSIITSVSYRIEGSEARALLPVDGIFDSQEEAFQLPEAAAEPGATLFLEATDARGNRAAWTGLVRDAKKENRKKESKPTPNVKAGAEPKPKEAPESDAPTTEPSPEPDTLDKAASADAIEGAWTSRKFVVSGFIPRPAGPGVKPVATVYG